MYYLSKQYKRYDSGGQTNSSGTGASSSYMRAGLGIANGAMGLVDAMTPANDFGRKPMGVSVASSALKGAALGSVAGPVGTVVGGLIGGVSGYVAGAGAKKAEQRFVFNQQQQQMNQLRNRSQATLANDPEQATGNVGGGFYAAGGPLSRNYLTRTMQAEGGSLTPMNSDAVEVNGPSHEQGGVQLPGQGAEVEGGETMKDDFVFSERLGFADEHKRLARAIGKVEDKKVMTPERVNALNRMKEREQKLMLSQEYLKHTMAHFGQPVE